MSINEASLMRIKIDYIQNSNELDSSEYKAVILDLIFEVERLMAVNAAANARYASLHCNND